ncbi:hypothetical protein D5S17_11820 [Pseudonocardiaceae bacterium YIM PH 21723]|nr:hypothetical protein D5S17_11820 [Pseudonocardiaceae bacterium YIM PH 21723]
MNEVGHVTTSSTEQQPADSPDGDGPAPQIELRIPATATQLHVARTVAGDLAMREDFDLDAIDDLRLAVDEACAMLVGRATDGEPLICTFAVRNSAITISAQVRSETDGQPSASGLGSSASGLGWRVLATLTDKATCDVSSAPNGGHLVRITLTKAKGGVIG